MVVMNNVKAKKRDVNSGGSHPLDILQEMRRQGIPDEFISLLMRYLFEYNGIKGLMEMWMEEASPKERNYIIEDLQECLDDIVGVPLDIQQSLNLQIDDLKNAKNDILEFKAKLRNEVDKRGGISELSRKSGIPQPSLSRFFSSSSMPRRTTLYKITSALDLPESAIKIHWTR
jgi:DNA-binding phage protein